MKTAIQNLENTIKELKAGRTMTALKAEDKKLYYKVKSLSSKLSELKAQDKGQFLTKEHLVEYKPLIIWILKNKANYRGYMNLKESMQSLLDKVENQKIVFKTKRGIKGIIANLALNVGLENSEKNMIEANGIDIIRENTYNNSLLSDFQDFRLNALD